MQTAEPRTEPMTGFEIVADFHFSGRSFYRGERRSENDLFPLKSLLLAAGLIRSTPQAPHPRY